MLLITYNFFFSFSWIWCPRWSNEFPHGYNIVRIGRTWSVEPLWSWVSQYSITKGFSARGEKVQRETVPYVCESEGLAIDWEKRMDEDQILGFVTAYLRKKGFTQTEHAFQEELQQNKNSSSVNSIVEPDIAKHILNFSEYFLYFSLYLSEFVSFAGSTMECCVDLNIWMITCKSRWFLKIRVVLGKCSEFYR